MPRSLPLRVLLIATLLVACSRAVPAATPPSTAAQAVPPPAPTTHTRLAAEAPSLAPLVSVDGVARDQTGRPVAGALVAIVPANAAHAFATTSAGVDGHFHFVVPSDRYAFTATAPGFAAGYRPMAQLESQLSGADITLGGNGAFTITGTVRIDGLVNAGAKVCAWRLSDVDGDTFYAATDSRGGFTLTLPPARAYALSVDAPDLLVPGVAIRESKDQTVVLTGSTRSPAPEDVVAWVRRSAIPIATADPTHDVADLEPLGPIIGSARVVALGEATHGTREFFQLKHRVLEYLVERQGFTVFGIEANYPESLAVNEYVLHGKGNPKAALAGMYFWTWNTEEVLAQIEWMRAWNADPKHTKKVKFVGFDMQSAWLAVVRVLDYLAKVDASAAKTAAPSLYRLSPKESYASLPAEQRARTRSAIVDLLALFDREKNHWIARTSAEAWAVARQHAVVVEQAEHEYELGQGGRFDWREESMANNVRWILDQEPRGARMVVWAHNGHVNKELPGPYVAMGSHLARALGKDYVSLGFVFDRGAFQATAEQEGEEYHLGVHAVGEAPGGDVAEAFHRAGKPIFLLDLRTAPTGIVADWLAVPHSMREIGAVYRDEATMSMPVVLPRRFDAVIYVDETTSARPVGAGEP